MDEPIPSELQQLADRLGAGATLFRADKRDGCKASLAAVLHYLRAVNMQQRLKTPLLALFAALEDAAEGRDNPITRTEKRLPAAQRVPRKEASDRGWAAASVDLLIKSKVELKQALAIVSPIVHMRRNELDDFRKNLRKGKAPDDAIAMYNIVMAEAAKSDHSPEGRANRAIAGLRDKAEK